MNQKNTSTEISPRTLLMDMFRAAVASASPRECLPAHLPKPPKGRTIVVGAGKAAAAMAATLEDYWPTKVEGLVITRYGHSVPTRMIEVVEASHPVPDRAGQEATGRILRLVQTLTSDDLVICLISGGGSALLAAPPPGITLEDKRALNAALLRSGASINEMNTVRKHLSLIKGGRLAVAAAPARVVSLIISDVPNDDVSTIASGPTVGDPTTSNEALAVLEKYRLDVPDAIRQHLRDVSSETPKPNDPIFKNIENIVIATPQASLDAAAAVARKAGYHPLILSDAIEGEARDVASFHAAVAKQSVRYGQPVSPPCVLISGGETTVTVRKKGRGGRNAEFLLALALALKGEDKITAIACDTDGIDGSEDNAGAMISGDTLKRAFANRLDPQVILDNNDAYSFFDALGDLVVTGPTLTNVNDFRAILVAGDETEALKEGDCS